MNPITFERIEAYLSKRLSSSERKSFEEEISADASLKEMVVKMQLLRKITERNLTRSKIISIHEVKTAEWEKELSKTEEEFEEKVTLLTPNNNDVANETLIPSEEILQEDTNLLEEVVAEEEIAEVDEEVVYDYEEPPRRGNALSIVLTILILSIIAGSIFIYLAKTPITVREGNPLLTAKGVALDSAQKVYVEIYEEGVTALAQNNNLAAINHFEDVTSFDRLPGYYLDASHFLNAAAHSQQQQPNRATKLLNSIILQKSFAYPYTNKDKIQVWCKIYWAKIMGFDD